MAMSRKAQKASCDPSACWDSAHSRAKAARERGPIGFGSRLGDAWVALGSRLGHAWVIFAKCRVCNKDVKKAGWGRTRAWSPESPSANHKGTHSTPLRSRQAAEHKGLESYANRGERLSREEQVRNR